MAVGLMDKTHRLFNTGSLRFETSPQQFSAMFRKDKSIIWLSHRRWDAVSNSQATESPYWSFYHFYMAWWPEISGAQPNCCGVKKQRIIQSASLSSPSWCYSSIGGFDFCYHWLLLECPPTYTQTGTQWKASTSDLGITPDYLNG